MADGPHGSPAAGPRRGALSATGPRAHLARTGLLSVVLLALAAKPVLAQLLERPWLRWHTITTAHFAVQYPPSLAPWARAVAARIEGVDSAVSGVVGFTPAERVQIVIEDPYEISNGFAFPLLRHPAIVFWATPPDPREDIGSYRIWAEMLASHEFAHIAHLARPSRNPLSRALWRALPVDVGPIPLRAPRWVMEGYATYVEGRVTGSGRPHGVWRPAILRQWAIEGHLPTYAQLSDWSDYEGQSFAYLAGSAYLEWLARRAGEGDSSLVYVWRRLTARHPRSFDEAFTGVYGDAPAVLYGRFVAEVTASAMQAERRLQSAGLVQGALVQHLAWGTGDPAISADGSRVALVLRSGVRPGRVVVWSTAPEADTGEARARARLLQRDPEDVPARRFYPAPKREIATLHARGGRAFDGPRWLRDGRHVLVWRFGRRPDGSYRPDLYVWDTQVGAVRQVTRGAGVRDADPTPDGQTAAGTRCDGGHCDLVMVDLRSGTVRTLAQGDDRTSFYRPRVAPDGRTIAASMQRGGRWRIVLVDATATDAGTQPRVVDPDDGADRFDAAWVAPSALVVISDQTGTTNLERLQLDGALSQTVAIRELTRITGAAAAPDPDAADGSIWYLALHSRGYDVRRLDPRDSVSHADSLPLRDARLVPVVPQPPRLPPRPLEPQGIGRERFYGLGPRSTRWFPTGVAGPGGGTLGLALTNIDVVGRLSLLAQGAVGSGDAWRGGAVQAAWRGTRPSVRADAFLARQGAATAFPASLLPALELRGGSVRADITRALDVAQIGATIGGSLARLAPVGQPAAGGASVPDATRRNLAFVQLQATTRQGGDGPIVSEGISLHVAAGETGDDGASARYQRMLLRGGITLGGAVPLPFSANAAYGHISPGAPLFERFAIGGPASPLVDPDLLAQRLEMPALPAGIATGDQLLAFRVSAPLGALAPFYWGASVRDGGGRFAAWHRVAGVEVTLGTAPFFVMGTPGARARVGIARSVDAPYAGRTVGYASIVLTP